MADRTVSVKLTADISGYTSSIAKAAVETKALSGAVERESVKIEAVSRSSGEKAGGALAQGLNQGLIRNSPMIAAGIAGAMAVGAPAALAGAGLLFGGLAAAAIAGNQEVSTNWSQLMTHISTGAADAAKSTIPVFVGMAGNIAGAFDRLEPSLAKAFSAGAPQLADFTESLTFAAESAMPGFVRAVQGADPVVSSLGQLVATFSGDLGNMFGDLAQYAPQASDALDGLSGILHNGVVPILSTFLTTGTQVASTMLPLLSTGLGLLTGPLSFVQPLLPDITEGFAGFKIGDAIGGWMGSAAKGIGAVGDAMGGGTEEGGPFSDMLSAVGDHAEDIGEKAGPLLGAAISALTIIMSNAQERANSWAQALKAGGQAADDAREAMSSFATSGADEIHGIGDFLTNTIPGGTGAMESYAISVGQAKDALKDQWAAMSPLQQAQSKVAEWTATLNDRIQNQGVTAGDTQIAFRKLAEWTDKEREAQEKLKLATEGVTQAMADQANAARSRVDADFAYQDAVDGTQEALEHLNDVKAHLHDTDEKTRTTVEDLDDATRSYNEQLMAQVDASARIAQADLPAAMSDQQKAILGSKAALDALNGLIAQGVVLPQSMEDYRQKLIQITGQADGAQLAQAELSAAVGELGFAVAAVPGEKAITITAPTDELRQKLTDLGFTITTMPDGTVKVSAETADAVAHLGDLSTLLTGVGAMTPTPTVALDTTGADLASTAIRAVLTDIGLLRPTPVANLDAVPLLGAVAAGGAALTNLANQRPVPVAGLNGVPLLNTAGVVLGALANVAAQHPTPTVSVNDQASGPIGGILGRLNSLVSRTVTVTAIQKIIPWVGGSATGGPTSSIKAASGRIVGPGTGTSDSVPARGPNGEPWSLSNGEWVINAAVSHREGDAAMAALNAGRATIASTDPVRSREMAGGGRTGGYGGINMSGPTVHVYLDGQEWRGIARIEAEGVYTDGLTASMQRARSN